MTTPINVKPNTTAKITAVLLSKSISATPLNNYSVLLYFKKYLKL